MEYIADNADQNETAGTSRKSTSATSAAPAPASLKFISTTLSADGKHVHMHFVTRGGPMVTVQLAMPEAIAFRDSLGTVLDQARRNDAPPRGWH
jgi:hypothetical protein